MHDCLVVSTRELERVGEGLKHMPFPPNSPRSAYELDDIIIHGKENKTEDFNLSILLTVFTVLPVSSATNFAFF